MTKRSVRFLLPAALVLFFLIATNPAVSAEEIAHPSAPIDETAGSQPSAPATPPASSAPASSATVVPEPVQAPATPASPEPEKSAAAAVETAPDTSIPVIDARLPNIPPPAASVSWDEPEVAATKGQSMVKMRGNYGMSAGFTSDAFLWKWANGDWQEKNWRYAFHDLDVNTYDPRIYDRYELEIETDTRTPWNGYVDFVMDPWTFIQVGNQTVFAASNDSVQIRYKSWENTGYTINQTYRTMYGNIVSVPESKIVGHQVSPFQMRPLNTDTFLPMANRMNCSQGRTVDMDYIFRPIRKLWVEYDKEPFYLKVFPIADQAEALTSDDPLHLSNNHVYYAPSPWLWHFDPGMTFSNSIFSQGYPQQAAQWNWDEEWFAENSNRQYLTFLRGGTAVWSAEDFASLAVTVASPMGYWDYYEAATSVPMAARFKMTPNDKLTVGSTCTAKLGVTKQKVHGQNYVLGGDVSYNLWDRTEVYGELAGSLMKIREFDDQLVKTSGEAYKLGVKSKNDFGAGNTVTWDSSFAFMSQYFSPGLADYRDTREDRDWGRHIWFDPLSADDQNCRIGDSIDINRYTIGANAIASIKDNTLNLFLNWRNVHDTVNKKFVENTTRLEAVYNPTGTVQIKGLALVRNYHDTRGRTDPILHERYTDLLLLNGNAVNGNIIDGLDATIMTFSGGPKVDLFDRKLTLYAIYEATNDPQDFPRNILNNPINVFSETDNVELSQLNYDLYGQNIFNLPPYRNYFSMWKACAIFTPVSNVQIRYTHVTNTNKNYAALFDNNHTHDEVVLIYSPFKSVTWTTGCSISRVNDLMRAVDTAGVGTLEPERKYNSHTNVYSQLNWDFKKDQRLTFQFGDAWFITQEGDVFGPRWVSQNTSVLDTRGIFRIWYQGKF